MTRLISFSATWPQYVNTDPSAGATKCVTRRFKTVWTDGETNFPTHPKNWRGLCGADYRKIIIPSWWDHPEGEPTLKVGEVFEGVEWSPLVGPRWVCDRCWRQGPKGGDWVPAGGLCECSNTDAWQRRGPQRGVLARHLETRIVRLGDDDGCHPCGGGGRLFTGGEPLYERCPTCGGGGSAEAAREGFPGLSWAQFTEKCFPGVPLESKVARIHFARIEG